MQDIIITSIEYKDDHGMTNVYTVNGVNITKIEEYRARGEGDKWYYDVFINDKVVRLFDFSQVTFEKLTTNQE